MDNKVFTLSGVPVYSSTLLQEQDIIRTIPQGQLITFERELIRKGKSLIRLRDNKGGEEFIRNNWSHIHICDKCKAKEGLHIIQMPHHVFRENVIDPKLKVFEIKKEFIDAVTDEIKHENGHTLIQIKGEIERKDKKIPVLSIVEFKTTVSDAKIVTLQDQEEFYIIDKKIKKDKPKFIKTSKGEDGIIISPGENYKIINPLWQNLITGFAFLIGFGTAIAMIILILVNSGWLVFIGILFLLVGYVISLIIAVPLILLGDFIRKIL